MVDFQARYFPSVILCVFVFDYFTQVNFGRAARRLCLCCVQTLEGARPKGAPLLCRVRSDDVQTMHARRAERHEQNSTFYFSTFYYKPFEGSDII